MSSSKYLHTLGEKLALDVSVMWTGPRVVPRVIPTSSIEELAKVIRRKPLIWDNIHANDYDKRRVFLGPYKNRPLELKNHLRGVLTNPNCEYEANFVALHTLAQWAKSPIPPDASVPSADLNPNDRSSAKAEEAPAAVANGTADVTVQSDIRYYEPRAALLNSFCDWLPSFFVEARATDTVTVTSVTPKMTVMTNDSETAFGKPSAQNASSAAADKHAAPQADAAPETVLIVQQTVVRPVAIGTKKLIIPSDQLSNGAIHDVEAMDSYMQPVKCDDGPPTISIDTDGLIGERPLPIPVLGSVFRAGAGDEPMDTGSRRTSSCPPPLQDGQTSHEVSADTSPRSVPIELDADEEPQNAPLRDTLRPAVVSTDASEASKSTVLTVSLSDAALEVNKMESDSGQTLLLPNREATGVADSASAEPPLGIATASGAHADATATDTESSASHTSSSMNAFQVEDLVLLADMFYLPFEYGPCGVHILEEVRWLKANAHLLQLENKVQSPSPPAPPATADATAAATGTGTTHAHQPRAGKSLADSRLVDTVKELAKAEAGVHKTIGKHGAHNEPPAGNNMDVVSGSTGTSSPSAGADAEQQKQGPGSTSDVGSSSTMPGSMEALAAMADADEWRRRAQQLTETITRVSNALMLFSKIPNRAIFYDLHPYFADAHSVLLVVRHYINWLGI